MFTNRQSFGHLEISNDGTGAVFNASQGYRFLYLLPYVSAQSREHKNNYLSNRFSKCLIGFK